MATTIVLKDAAGADVTYTKVSQIGAKSTFVATGTNLQDRAKLELSVIERANTNRIVGKLSIPTVQDNTSSGGDRVVAWTEVGSFDLSSVLKANTAAAEDFIAQFRSLVATNAVKDAYTLGASI